ncbi:MAG: flagellar hook-basal body complex protein [Proteobacteria bacterium]|nr:flagellar hook-basal body complex protein [Pseudomonadota bacterium]
MSLFGALSSGVSGLTAQSSAMGAIADNITNVSTVGYKNTRVDFQTLVTKQTSSTLFSAGGVQSKPRQDTGVQGLLQASSSQTDISISGQGYFVVNEANTPTLSNEFLYTRAGSFFQDKSGFLRNTAGFYLQAWPTDANGSVIPANTSLTVSNQNIVSTDYLATVNLSQVGGTASATSTIGIGTNLPANDTAGATHKTDVQFFDSLGNAANISFVYTKSPTENQWDLSVAPPSGSAVLTIEDGTSPTALVYDSTGQLEFDILDSNGIARRPNDGATLIIEGITYAFNTTGTPPADTATVKQVDVRTNTTVTQDVASLVAVVITSDSDFDNTNNRIVVSAASTTTILFKDDGTRAITVDPTGLLDSTGTRITAQDNSLTVKKPATIYRDYAQFTFPGLPADADTMTINGIVYTFSTAEGSTSDDDTTIRRDTLADMLADLESSIEANDPNFATGGTAIRTRQNNDASEPTPSGVPNTLVISSLASGSFNVVFSGGFTNVPTEPDGTATFTAGGTFALVTTHGIIFNSDGLPSTFNVKKLEILDFASGASDMNDASGSSKKITLDLGTVGVADGFTQFGAAFTPVFINQNGSRFGTFAGVTINTRGLVTALFDNGETRPIYQIPIATFVNVNGLESKTGNVWSATEGSGDVTLRVADNGPAGQIIQGALEASTVDIGEEFTKMIVVQRAFSASAKIISTTDDMLEELLRIKR